MDTVYVRGKFRHLGWGLTTNDVRRRHLHVVQRERLLHDGFVHARNHDGFVSDKRQRVLLVFKPRDVRDGHLQLCMGRRHVLGDLGPMGYR